MAWLKPTPNLKTEQSILCDVWVLVVYPVLLKIILYFTYIISSFNPHDNLKK